MQLLLHKIRDKVATLQNYTVKTAARTSVAMNALRNPEGKTATALIMAVRNLWGIDALYWEPETLWVTMEKAGIDLSEEDRNKLQAAISVIRNPSCFYDNLVFQRTVQALNGELFDPENLQECHPAHMAWALYEAALLRGLDPETQEVPEVDEDVQQYIAVCLKRAGYVYPPTELSFVVPNLLKLLPKHAVSNSEAVKNSWAHLDKEALTDRKYPEDPLSVQLAQLASCYEYVKDRISSMAVDILELENAA